ncbi:DUF1461 domain-containing protein [Leucothrix arctica]|uniref:DUF1461 domain-containing protein n=1 Tax=Leucothrix arctica TaxID=1481894 RepID=A0A317CLG3_9GAMM|nr:DUF1461 domain-containing protein [Leucothrix arctica]PWQ99368.1 DUF1461 domain-containing protein [Leucothrix arctica]
MGNVRWLCVTVIAFCLALGASWLLLAQVDFAYDWLYSFMDIPKHIAKYAPEYAERADFVETNFAEHSRMFAEVVTAIHNQGGGLATLSYYSPDGQLLNTAFNNDEVIHLQDVAILIDRLLLGLKVMLVVFVVLLAWLSITRQVLPSFKSLLAYVIIALLLITVVVLLVGPYEIFSQLHIWVFPEEHKWKFYYEESVMSNLMKAPDLFAYIAVLLVVLAVPIFAVMMWLVKQFLGLRSQNNV